MPSQAFLFAKNLELSSWSSINHVDTEGVSKCPYNIVFGIGWEGMAWFGVHKDPPKIFKYSQKISNLFFKNPSKKFEKV